MNATADSTLVWKVHEHNYSEATLPNPDGTVGVRMSLSYRPTCYRRGKFLLLVEVMPGEFHHDWGCFDAQDQPSRNFHNRECALLEAQALADVLWQDFLKTQRN